jgi:hypothetical protein
MAIFARRKGKKEEMMEKSRASKTARETVLGDCVCIYIVGTFVSDFLCGGFAV